MPESPAPGRETGRAGGGDSRRAGSRDSGVELYASGAGAGIAYRSIRRGCGDPGGLVFTAILPCFYWALYLNEDGLPVSRDIRRPALIALALTGIGSVLAISGWVGSFGRTSVLEPAVRSWTVEDTYVVFGLLANLAGVPLLLALFRLAGDGTSTGVVAVSKRLRLAIRIAGIAGSIVMIGCVIGIAITPWAYSDVRHRLPEVALKLSRFALDRVRTASLAISAYLAPVVVWRETRGR